jgi:galactokinase
MKAEIEDQLFAIYGKGAAAQLPRYTALANRFEALFGPSEILLVRAPGRVNLIGGHTDYNQGYVLPVALDKDIVLAARPRSDGRIKLYNCEEQFTPFVIESGTEVPHAPAGDWSNYVRGVVQHMARQLQRPLLGFDGLVTAAEPHGTPRGVGLSSSSALTVLTTVALAHINQWQPETTELVQFCSDAEWYVGTRGGIMDHFISLLGQKDQALFLDCRPDRSGRYQTQHVPLPTDHTILVVNSGTKHDNTRGHYNRRVAACRVGVAFLRHKFAGIHALRDVEDVAWAEIDPLLPQEITVAEANAGGISLEDLPGISPEVTLKVKQRCRHVWSENRRVLQAVQAMRRGDTQQVGQLLTAANQSLRDDYEVSCPEVDTLAQILQDQDGVTGMRLTGAGWGGCLVALVQETAVTTVRQHTQEKYRAVTGIHADVFVCQPGPGAGLVNS